MAPPPSFRYPSQTAGRSSPAPATTTYNPTCFPPTNRRPPSPGRIHPSASGSAHYPPQHSPTTPTSPTSGPPVLTRQEKADAIREIKTLLSQVRNDWEYVPPPSSEERRRKREEREERRVQRARAKKERLRQQDLERRKSVKMQAGILRTSSLRSGGLGEWRTSGPGALPDTVPEAERAEAGEGKGKGKSVDYDVESDETDSEYEELEKKRKRERGEYVWEDAWATDALDSDADDSDTASEGGQFKRTTFFSSDSSDHDDSSDSDDSSSLDAAPPTNTTSFRRRASSSASTSTLSPAPKSKAKPIARRSTTATTSSSKSKKPRRRRRSFSHRLSGTWLPRLPDSPPHTPPGSPSQQPHSPSALSPIHSLRQQARQNPNLRTFLRKRDQWTHADTEGWVPLAKSRFADNPMRQLVRPEAYQEIFERCVVKGSELPVPIPLGTMLLVLKEGWQREGEWPPRVTPTPPPRGAKGAEWNGSSLGAPTGGGGLGLGRMKRYFGMR